MLVHSSSPPTALSRFRHQASPQPSPDTSVIVKVLPISFPFLVAASTLFTVLYLPSSFDRASGVSSLERYSQAFFLPNSRGKKLPQLCFAMTFGFEGDGRFCRGRKKPKSHVYMCSAEHRVNCRNPLTHTFDHQAHVSPKPLLYHQGRNCQ